MIPANPTSRDTPADPALFNAVRAYHEYVQSQPSRTIPNKKTYCTVERILSSGNGWSGTQPNEISLSGDCLYITAATLTNYNIAGQVVNFRIAFDSPNNDYIPFILQSRPVGTISITGGGGTLVAGGGTIDPIAGTGLVLAGRQDVWIRNFPFSKLYVVCATQVASLSFTAFGNNTVNDMPDINGA